MREISKIRIHHYFPFVTPLFIVLSLHEVKQRAVWCVLTSWLHYNTLLQNKYTMMLGFLGCCLIPCVLKKNKPSASPRIALTFASPTAEARTGTKQSPGQTSKGLSPWHKTRCTKKLYKYSIKQWSLLYFTWRCKIQAHYQVKLMRLMRVMFPANTSVSAVNNRSSFRPRWLTHLSRDLNESLHAALAVVALGGQGGHIVPPHGRDDVQHGLCLVGVWRHHAREEVVSGVITQLWGCGCIADLRNL